MQAEAAARELEGFRGFRGLKPALAKGRLECPNKRGLCAGNGRLQCWNADGQELGGSCREGCAGKGQAATLEQQRLMARLGGRGFEAWQTAGSNGLTREGYVQVKGRLQCWNADGQERAGCNPGAAKAEGFEAWQTAGSNALSKARLGGSSAAEGF